MKIKCIKDVGFVSCSPQRRKLKLWLYAHLRLLWVLRQSNSRPPALPQAEQNAKTLLFLPSITAALRHPGAALAPGRPAAGASTARVHSTTRESLLSANSDSDSLHQSRPRRAAFEQKVKRFVRSNFLMFGGICQDTCKFCIRPGHHLPADELRCPRAPTRLGSSCGLQPTESFGTWREALSRCRNRKGVSATTSRKALT